jgi:hypothetical protein
VCYLVPFALLAPAADVRYNHWSIVCMFIVVAAACSPRNRQPGTARSDVVAPG